MSDEQKRKISLAQKGLATKGRGWKQPESQKLKVSERLSGHEFFGDIEEARKRGRFYAPLRKRDSLGRFAEGKVNA